MAEVRLQEVFPRSMPSFEAILHWTEFFLLGEYAYKDVPVHALEHVSSSTSCSFDSAGGRLCLQRGAVTLRHHPHCRGDRTRDRSSQCRKTRGGEPLAPWPRRASPRSWWTMEKAFRTVSLRLEAKTEVLGSVDHKLGVVVDEASTGGIALEALSRPDAATCSSTSNRAA